jgi:hypothetical protein
LSVTRSNHRFAKLVCLGVLHRSIRPKGAYLSAGARKYSLPLVARALLIMHFTSYAKPFLRFLAYTPEALSRPKVRFPHVHSTRSAPLPQAAHDAMPIVSVIFFCSHKIRPSDFLAYMCTNPTETSPTKRAKTSKVDGRSRHGAPPARTPIPASVLGRFLILHPHSSFVSPGVLAVDDVVRLGCTM